MTEQLTERQLTGIDDSHLVVLPCGQRLQARAAAAFAELQSDARAAGFELTIASAYRSFERQLAIWNGKASGARPVHDDLGHPVAMGDLSPQRQLHAILRYSAIPGTSRHHWGTDVDVYDAAAVPAQYQVQLTPAEVAPDGLFDPLHRWLDQCMSAGDSHGFYRPYGGDRGGVAPERWHLSYAPQALDCEASLTCELLQCCWDAELAAGGLLLREEIDRELPDIMARYVTVDECWCPMS